MNGSVRHVAVLVLISGMCALVFQTTWLREFRLIFGASTPATGAVLAIFMGGLGLGNAILGRRCDGTANALRLYAYFELGISVAAVVSPLLVWLVRATYIATGGQENLGGVGATVLRLLLAALVLGAPTFLMGGTLPAAARAITGLEDAGRRSVGLLYGLNTLGAVAGVVLTTFFLLEMLGTRVTLWAACAVNLLNSLAAWRLSQSHRFRASSPDSFPNAADSRNQPANDGPARNDSSPASSRSVAIESATDRRSTIQEHGPIVVYLVAGFVGFSFFLMELVWYRMLAPILGGSTFTFGLILAVALAGIGVGGAMYPWAFRDRRCDLRSLALTLSCEALALAVPFALGDRLALLALVLRLFAYYGFAGQVVGWLVVTSIVVFPAALVSGLQFPVLISLLGQGRKGLGRQIGQAFAWNTFGAVAGSLAGGFGLISLLTALDVWKLVVVLLCVFALAIVVMEFCYLRQTRRLLQPLGLIVAAVLCLGATGPTAVWRHSGIGAGRAQMPFPSPNDLRSWMNNQRRDILWQADGRESSVAIQGRNGATLILNGKADGSAVTDAGTQIMLGALGVLLHPQPRDALVIGLGTGESAGWLAHQPEIRRVDVVELEPAVRRVVDLCAPINHDVQRHAKVRIVFNDARETLQTTRRKYDLIASEPSNPYRSGVSSLYTREFYLAVRERLRPRGVFLQWVQGYEIDVSAVRTVVRTLCDVFPHVEIWETDPMDTVFVCSPDPVAYTVAELQQRMSEPAMRDALRVAWRTRTVEGILAHFVASHRFTQLVAARRDVPRNTDDRNVLEYGFARTVGRRTGFSVGDLREEAVSLDRSQRIEKGVDWEAVEDAYVAYHAVFGESPPPSRGDRARRGQALVAFRSGSDLAQAARLWESQPKPPRDLLETLAVAAGFAALGDERALKLVEPVRDTCPIEAAAIAALLAARQHRHEQAVETLVGVFTALRTDPTPLGPIVELSLRTALEIAEQHPEHARPLYESLCEPFAVLVAQDRRVAALCLLGQLVGPRELADALYLMEPDPQWDIKILELRVQTYERTKHALLPVARRELSEFLRHAPDRNVLRSAPARGGAGEPKGQLP